MKGNLDYGSKCQENSLDATVDDGDSYNNIAQTYNGGSPRYRVQEYFYDCDHDDNVYIDGDSKWECGTGYEAIGIQFQSDWFC